VEVPGKLQILLGRSPPGEWLELVIGRFVLQDPEEDEGHGGVEEDLGGEVEEAKAASGCE